MEAKTIALELAEKWEAKAARLKTDADKYASSYEWAREKLEIARTLRAAAAELRAAFAEVPEVPNTIAMTDKQCRDCGHVFSCVRVGSISREGKPRTCADCGHVFDHDEVPAGGAIRITEVTGLEYDPDEDKYFGRVQTGLLGYLKLEFDTEAYKWRNAEYPNQVIEPQPPAPSPAALTEARAAGMQPTCADCGWLFGVNQVTYTWTAVGERLCDACSKKRQDLDDDIDFAAFVRGGGA